MVCFDFLIKYIFSHVDGVDDIVNIIGDAVFRPRFKDEEIEMARQTILFENDAMRRNPECEPLLTDWIHKVPFIICF